MRTRVFVFKAHPGNPRHHFKIFNLITSAIIPYRFWDLGMDIYFWATVEPTASYDSAVPLLDICSREMRAFF